MIPFFNCGNPRDDIELEDEDTDQHSADAQEDDLDIGDIKKKRQKMRQTSTKLQTYQTQPGCLIV